MRPLPWLGLAGSGICSANWVWHRSNVSLARAPGLGGLSTAKGLATAEKLCYRREARVTAAARRYAAYHPPWPWRPPPSAAALQPARPGPAGSRIGRTSMARRGGAGAAPKARGGRVSVATVTPEGASADEPGPVRRRAEAGLGGQPRTPAGHPRYAARPGAPRRPPVPGSAPGHHGGVGRAPATMGRPGGPRRRRPLVPAVAPVELLRCLAAGLGARPGHRLARPWRLVRIARGSRGQPGRAVPGPERPPARLQAADRRPGDRLRSRARPRCGARRRPLSDQYPRLLPAAGGDDLLHGDRLRPDRAGDRVDRRAGRGPGPGRRGHRAGQRHRIGGRAHLRLSCRSARPASTSCSPRPAAACGGCARRRRWPRSPMAPRWSTSGRWSSGSSKARSPGRSSSAVTCSNGGSIPAARPGFPPWPGLTRGSSLCARRVMRPRSPRPACAGSACARQLTSMAASGPGRRPACPPGPRSRSADRPEQQRTYIP